MMKKVLPWLVIVLLGALLITVFIMKDSMNNYVSKVMQEQAGSEVTITGEAYINKNYNYTQNGQSYNYTLLEFGATNCSACKRMEKVLDEIRQSHSETVKVVFHNVMHPESQSLIKYYGVSAIPLQIILDREGKEVYRHYGYIPADELIPNFASR